MTTDQQTHIHTWVFWKVNFKERNYRCIDPDCDVIKPASLLLGKRSICAKCKINELILTTYDLKMKWPKCEDCSGTAEAKEKRKMKEIARMTLIGQSTNGEQP
jgi:hypothetical protein